MTRTNDSDPGWNSRINTASNVDAVISIHWNAFNGTAQGTETFYAATRPGDYSFAETLNDNVVTNLNRSNRGVKDDTQSQHDRLAILRDPAGSQTRALIEIEFIT